MSHVLLLALIAVSLALAAALARATANLRNLRTELQAAHETQHTRDSQLDTIRNEFIANISHELRTPLTSIRGSLGLLTSGLLAPVDPRAQNLLGIALSNTERLIRLSNDVLDLERISSGQVPLKLRRCSMRELAQQAIETMTSQADAARVRLHLILHAPPGCMFFDGDPDRILQVLTNLLSNAIKFSLPSSIVEIHIETEPGNLRVRVSDSGRGIPPEKLQSIFGRFEQVQPSDATQKGGAGLGLAICRKLLEQHNGVIWAESDPERPGASLLFTLPCTSRQQDIVEAAAFRGTILICDTDLSLRSLVATTLHRHGYRVLEASAAEHALELAADTPVDAILLDLALPGREGMALIDWLRRQPVIGNLPLIVYSVPRVATEHSASLQPIEPSTEVHPHEIETLVLNIVHRLRAPNTRAAA